MGRVAVERGAWPFFLLTFAFSWGFWIPTAWVAQSPASHGALADFLLGPFNPAPWGPLVSALILTGRAEGGRGVVRFLRRGLCVRFGTAWLGVSLILPCVLFGGAVWMAALAGLRPWDPVALADPGRALIGFWAILFLAGPLQEEFGWRGYALVRLQSRFHALRAGLIVGLFWWLWHLPLVFVPGGFIAGDPVVYLGLSVVVLPTSVLFTWIYNNTHGSVLATMLAHASMNWSLWVTLPDMRLDLPTCVFMMATVGLAVIFVVKAWGAARLAR